MGTNDFRLSGSNLIGQDINDDGHPDLPLEYTFESGSQIEFPLNFCPGNRFDWTEGENKKSQWHLTPDPVLYPCEGYWGLALKEWETIKQVKNDDVIYLYLTVSIQNRPTQILQGF